MDKWELLEDMQRRANELSAMHAESAAEYEASLMMLRTTVDLYLAEQMAHAMSMLNGIYAEEKTRQPKPAGEGAQ